MFKDLDDMLSDRITLVKKDGTVSRHDVPAIVTKGKIQIHDAGLPIEVGDHLLRDLPSGLSEDYVVLDPVLHRGLGKAFFIVEVARSQGGASSKSDVVQQITNHFHGANSRVNIHSTDMSTNMAGQLDLQAIRSLLAQINSALPGLPDEQRGAMKEPLDRLTAELAEPMPSSSRVRSLLGSIKAVAEGATGNLVAAGAATLIQNILV